MSEFIRIPVTKKSLRFRKPVCGVGINDADYVIRPLINGKKVICPYYQCWANMIERAYSKKYQEKQPTYKECSVVNEWHRFSVFRLWMEKQDWVGKHLDKDILIFGNKVYSPTSCMFLSGRINMLLTGADAKRGLQPKGVFYEGKSGKYRASCNNGVKRISLGSFYTAEEAEVSYLKYKASIIKGIAESDEVGRNNKLKSALLAHAERILSSDVISKIAGLRSTRQWITDVRGTELEESFNKELKELRSRIDGLSEHYREKMEALK